MLELLPFQRTGAEFLAGGQRRILADAMRVGKTPQAITGCDLVDARSIIVMCPAIARMNWLREFERWSICGRRGTALLSSKQVPSPKLTICSYDHLIDKKVFAAVMRKYDVAIADEFHYLKSLSTQRAQAAYEVMTAAKYAWALSGTPAPNNASELWAVMSKFGFTDLLYWDFLTRYCTFWEDPMYGARVTGNKNVEELKTLLKPHMLRRTLQQVAPEMPAVRWSEIVVEPGPIAPEDATPEFIETAKREEAELLRALVEAQDQLDLLDPEAALNFRRLVGLQKVTPIAELVAEELQSGLDRIVIFGWHTHVLRGLKQALKQFGAEIIDGKTPNAQRELHQVAFKGNNCRVLLCQILAAGTAVDLSASDDCLFVESDFVPANNMQAAMRCVSQFKRRPVRVRFASVAGSVDERVQRAVTLKSQMLEEIFS